MTKWHASGDRAYWLNTVAAKIMDGGTHPPSIERLYIIVPPEIVTRENDGHVTAAAALGEDARKDFKAGWRIIIDEMITHLREQGFVGGNDQALTWMKPLDGEWKVIMPDGYQITVFGQLERRRTRERAVVGERSEDSGARIGVPSLFETGRIRPLELQVIGSRGAIKEQSFELHPFALAIPPMTQAEREALRRSIEQDGVKVPIVIYQKKILDGRNRSYFASVFKKPVRIEEFEGTEDEARRHVAILNLHRRHLSTAQRYLAADNLFGRQAEKEAVEAQEKGRSYGQAGKPNSVLFSAPSSQADSGGKSYERAAKLAAEAGIPNITPAGMRAIKVVRSAPETKAAIERGEIKTVSDAHRTALKELNLARTVLPQTVDTLSINKRLGRCVTELQAILNTESEAPIGTVPEISGKLDQIEELVPAVRHSLRQRNIIR